MRRTRRQKFIKVSIFIIVYAIIQVVAPKDEPPQLDIKSSPSSLQQSESVVHTETSVSTTTHAPTMSTPEKDSARSGGGGGGGAKHNGKIKGGTGSGNTTTNSSTSNTAVDVLTGAGAGAGAGAGVTSGVVVAEEKVNVTKNSTNNECTPAAIRQFPRPLMSQTVRRHGGLIVHLIVAIYMFIGLAIVCDEYFVASLDRICEELKMSPDVAGATFMAAGSSAPELATVIIGVFYAEDDIGISGVIGSAVFNIMFVISVCALSTGTIVYLNWWPLVRDSIFYALSILIMLAVIGDKDVNWFESTVMLVTYIIYCIVLHFNTRLEKWALSLPLPFKMGPPTEESGLVTYSNLDDEKKYVNYGMEQNSEFGQTQQQQQQQEQEQEIAQWNPGQDWSPENQQPTQTFQEPLSGPALNQMTSTEPQPTTSQQSTSAPPPIQDSVRPDYYKPKEYDPSTKVNPLEKPSEEAGQWAKIKWATLYPIHFFCIYTMPDCRSDRFRNWYPFTFFVSMVWISFYSYFMVWMITIIGYTLFIPDTVMGLTFVAAGVSVPDALSSIAVIREGYGDMAVSNAIGSNVFDILVCLGLPWFIKTAIVQPGVHVKVISKGLMYSTFSLLSTVAFLVVAIHYNGWKLDRKFGVVLMIWYLLFIVFASLYELNVFGDLNPPECITDY